jgi:hypothetical protein
MLSPAAIAKLAASSISEAEAEAGGMFSGPDAHTLHASYAHAPFLALPYHHPDGSPASYRTGDANPEPFVRIRYLEPVSARRHGFQKPQELRYVQPPKSGIHAYFPKVPGGNWPAVLADPAVSLVITEGELKAYVSCLVGVATIGLGGVWMFATPDGALLPELAAIPWRGRTVYIAYDSDAVTNPHVLTAEARLIDELTKRGARCALVRIPPGAGDRKQGIDDFIHANSPQHWVALVNSTMTLSAVDRGVVALNEHLAWIEREEKAYDMRSGVFLSRHAIVNGSRYSALTVSVPADTGAGAGIKRIQTAKLWLTHPYAQRYDDVIFQPDAGATVEQDGKTSLNLWQGYETTQGDIGPFLELTDFIFERMPAEHRELALKLVAYKAQNPAKKIPLAIVLVGKMGAGKSLWFECVRQAFGQYGMEITSDQLKGDFNGWVEKSLFCVVNEAESYDLFRAKERIRSLISDVQRPMNEKFRVQRQVQAFAMYGFSANDRAAGSFSYDDRRMIVVDCPSKREDAFYARVGAWKNEQQGPRRLMRWLLELDLQGWAPPRTAPMTAEKYMSYLEGLTPVQRLAAEAMTADDGVVIQWLDAAMAWASAADTSGDIRAARIAEEIRANLKHFTVRPFYTPEEIAMLFPAIARDLFGNSKVYSTVAGHISRQLRNAGLPYLECSDDARGFKWRGGFKQYLVVADVDGWRQPITQAQFEDLMTKAPTYGAYQAWRMKNKVVPMRGQG